MADTSERIIILSAFLLAVIFIRSTQMYSMEPIYEIEITEGSSIGLWVEDDPIDPDKEVPMPSFDISDLLDPELALSHGFRGYIDISYVSKIPDRVNVTSEKMIKYTIRLELIPHVSEFTETEVLLAPENERAQFGILSSSGANLNEYIRYSPNGTIILRVDEPLNVTMILSVPEGFPTISEHAGNLIGVGIFADVPVASPGRVGLNRIPRDEG